MAMSSSSVSTPSSHLFTSEPPASSAPSTPPPEEDSGGGVEDDLLPQPESVEEDQETEKRFARLKFVLEKSTVYSGILRDRMEEDKAVQKAEFERLRAEKVERDQEASSRVGKGRKRARVEGKDSNLDYHRSKRRKGELGLTISEDETDKVEEPPIIPQPALITGAKMKNYQLEGLQWMSSLHRNGISGILADEMGLGKTLQTIAFSAHLREQGFFAPFMVVCPLSVLHNWIEEYAKFAPSIPVCMYHGTPAERAELRRTVMAYTPKPAKQASKPPPAKKSKAKTKAKAKPKAPTRSGNRRTSGRFTKKVVESDEEDDAEAPSADVEEDDESAQPTDSPSNDDDGALESFPIVITTYEMIIKDRAHLANYNWGYIVVDEGHRLKNIDCKLMQEIKKYTSAGRMILTGTPLHNNLGELWALLNFILPDIFTDIDSFQQWFNLPAMHLTLGSDRSSKIVDALHAILKPFLLRRLKADVEANLPPKKEYVLYAPLSIRQREAYDTVLNGSLRAYLIGTDFAKEETKENVKADEGPRKMRSQNGKRGRKSYAVDGDDDEYFDMLERGEVDERGVKLDEEKQDLLNISRNHQLRAKVMKVNNLKLQNTVMQLRKVCSHPFLFDWPVDKSTHMPILNEEIVDASGKMMVLDRLLVELFKRKHKVLLFSQFTTMLDIIEDWACELKGWKICRIDGSTPPLERRDQMNKFQTGGDAPDAPCLFLLSTRAGGLGINLVAADTVIFYDQDWNPQMDAQAQDRAHRIGQKKPVLIFRLVSAHTIETKIMQRASEKRQLEALVIAKGKFKMPAAAAGRTKAETMAEKAASLLRLEGEKIEVVPNTSEGKANVLSDADLDMLLDRRPEVFADRGKGWTSAGDVPDKAVVDGDVEGRGRKTAFAVYEAPVNEGNDALAKMLGEDIE